MIKAVADYVRNIQDTTDLDAIAKDVFQHSQVKYKAKYWSGFFLNLLCYTFVLKNCILQKQCFVSADNGNLLVYMQCLRYPNFTSPLSEGKNTAFTLSALKLNS